MKAFIERHAHDYQIGVADHTEVDKFNILNATHIAMHRALDGLCMSFDMIQVDGNRFKPYQDIPFECIVKGDRTHKNIAAASILAKEYRDQWIEDYVNQSKTPDVYGLLSNKGYGTLEHRNALKLHGSSGIHRKTFRSVS